ncbi:hypothetical protein X801_09522, partial [Opisthorchis viverrini]
MARAKILQQKTHVLPPQTEEAILHDSTGDTMATPDSVPAVRKKSMVMTGPGTAAAVTCEWKQWSLLYFEQENNHRRTGSVQNRTSYPTWSSFSVRLPNPESLLAHIDLCQSQIARRHTPQFQQASNLVLSTK